VRLAARAGNGHAGPRPAGRVKRRRGDPTPGQAAPPLFPRPAITRSSPAAPHGPPPAAPGVGRGSPPGAIPWRGGLIVLARRARVCWHVRWTAARWRRGLEPLVEGSSWWQDGVDSYEGSYHHPDPPRASLDERLRPWRKLIRWFQRRKVLREPSFVSIGEFPGEIGVGKSIPAVSFRGWPSPSPGPGAWSGSVGRSSPPNAGERRPVRPCPLESGPEDAPKVATRRRSWQASRKCRPFGNRPTGRTIRLIGWC
jgi:hypothetical protein